MNTLHAKLERQLLESIGSKLAIATGAFPCDSASGADDPSTAELEEVERELVNVVQCIRLVIASRKLVRE